MIHNAKRSCMDIQETFPNSYDYRIDLSGIYTKLRGS